MSYEQFGYFCFVYLLKRVFDFYLDASVHVAFSVFCLVKTQAVLYGISSVESVAFFAFFATIACYNFIKYGVEAEKYILVNTRYQRLIQGVSILSLFCALYFFFQFQKSTYLVIAVLLALSLLYALPILPTRKNFRSLGGLKIIIVALVWVGVTLLLPLTQAAYNYNWDVYVGMFQLVAFVVALMIPFEIRDLKYDPSYLKTLPQKVGVKKAKAFGIFLLSLMVALELFKDEINSSRLFALGVVVFVTSLLLLFASTKRSNYYCSFWVESMPIIWWGLLMLFLR